MIFFDGFIDSYYAYDFSQPENKQRAFTTQAPRHNEPNINLIHLGINLKDEEWRGRFALQAGNSVWANTIYEPNQNLGHIQEFYLGKKIGEVWIDAGVYLGHIGMESWISKNNFTYTRSLQLDYVPYYSAGIRGSYDLNSHTHFEIHLMNGWQNISETNSAKAIGTQFKYKNFTYNTFFGDEKVLPGQKDRFRTYHNFIFESKINENWKHQASFDLGTQSQQENNGMDTWVAFASTFQQKISNKNFVAYRLESYSDPHQCNILTDSDKGFQVMSSSVNFDSHVNENFIWRNELRGFYSKDHVMNTSVLITSVAISF